MFGWKELNLDDPGTSHESPTGAWYQLFPIPRNGCTQLNDSNITGGKAVRLARPVIERN